MFLYKALLVDPIDETFDPNSIPRNGMEYLQQVNYEAKNCDQVVVANIDTKQFENKRTPVLYNQPEPYVRWEHLPTEDLQREWLANFSDVRFTVERRKAIQIKNMNGHRIKKYRVPSVGNEDGWYKFCVGNYTPKIQTEEDDCESVEEKMDVESSSDNVEIPKVTYKKNVHLKKTEPHLHLLTGMSQVAIIEVLDYHVDWLKKNKTDFKHSGVWLYALLACLEIPLTPETCSTIRTLARMAALDRSKLTSDDDILDILNLTICLVGRYFRQLDLADP